MYQKLTKFYLSRLVEGQRRLNYGKMDGVTTYLQQNYVKLTSHIWVILCRVHILLRGLRLRRIYARWRLWRPRTSWRNQHWGRTHETHRSACARTHYNRTVLIVIRRNYLCTKCVNVKGFYMIILCTVYWRVAVGCLRCFMGEFRVKSLLGYILWSFLRIQNVFIHIFKYSFNSINSHNIT